MDEDGTYWCSRCKSMSIVESKSTIEGFNDIVYCKDCGSTEIDVGSYEEWEDVYKEYRIQKNINYGNRNFSSASIKAKERKIEEERFKALRSSVSKYYIK